MYKTLLEQFTNNELIDKATLDKQYEKELREGTGVFDANTEMGRKHWQDLRDEKIRKTNNKAKEDLIVWIR